MPMIVNDRRKRLAFLFGRQFGIRATGETLEQVQEQFRAEREQRAFDHRYYQEQIALLSRELAEARYEISRRDREKALHNDALAISYSSIHAFCHPPLLPGPNSSAARASTPHDRC
jgi:hypothetical protein